MLGDERAQMSQHTWTRFSVTWCGSATRAHQRDVLADACHSLSASAACAHDSESSQRDQSEAGSQGLVLHEVQEVLTRLQEEGVRCPRRRSLRTPLRSRALPHQDATTETCE